jgi:hypothetical protein
MAWQSQPALTILTRRAGHAPARKLLWTLDIRETTVDGEFKALSTLRGTVTGGISSLKARLPN